MRQPRLLGHGESVYHCIAEALPGIPPFDERDKAGLLHNLHRMERFTGVEVLTFCITDRRIRLLLRVPDPDVLSDAELFRRLQEYYPKELAAERVTELKRLRRAGKGRARADFLRMRSAYTGRMFDLAQFLKTLLQMFTQAYNSRRQWKGTLFRERFRSILIEPWEHAVFATAAYIELDAVREGHATDPRDYPYCGYGAAVKGRKAARTRLSRMGEYAPVPVPDWRLFAACYRGRLYAPKTLSARAVRAELAKRSPRLPLPVLLRCHLRYFDYGTVLGRPPFIESVYRANPDIFSYDRRTLCYKMRFADWRGLHSMRNPATGLVTVPKSVKTFG